ncbi:MAG: hypothetical protein Q9220_002413 [cf. Caloplaca sp. 1 TL-2023]
MTGKRKRHRPHRSDVVSHKRVKRDTQVIEQNTTRHPTLSLYYPHILTLRAYLLSKLPKSSKTRRRRIAALKDTSHSTTNFQACLVAPSDINAHLAKLLDRTLICIRPHENVFKLQSRDQDFQTFSQRVEGQDESSLLEGNTPQSEDDEQRVLSGIPGLVLHCPNSHVGTLKNRPWTDLLNLLGKDGEQIMLDLLVGCSIYMSVESGKENYYQLSGAPLTELQPLSHDKISGVASGIAAESAQEGVASGQKGTFSRSPSAITIVRNHVLNRYSDPTNPAHTTHILKYIFPRQFGLHNVFTSYVDSRETIQPFKDYTLREQEITQQKTRHSNPDVTRMQPSLPRRLRGTILKLTRKMQILHSRCAYYELLKHYCLAGARTNMAKALPNLRSTQHAVATDDTSQSNKTSGDMTQVQVGTECTDAAKTGHLPAKLLQKSSQAALVDYATPFPQISAFCRAVISKVVPSAFWGQDEANFLNKEVIFRKIDQFVRQRRFESLTLHEICQDLKIASMTWLVPPYVPEGARISSSDLRKRREILFEFLYYLFDSLLIPLIRSNFHVTESSVHKNRIFYFRHDIWRALTEPALTTIKQSMFEEVPTTRVMQLLDARALGFSQIRLLPKGDGVRPIMNLRRRVTKLQNGKAVLGRSINSILAPVHIVLDYARLQNLSSVGSALFSVGDMYPKLKAFRDRLCFGEHRMPRLYFAKVDVQSCFDTIPQRSALRVVEELVGENMYRIARHAQIRVPDAGSNGSAPYQRAKPVRKFLATAHPPLDFRNFDEVIEEASSKGKKHAVFVDNVLRSTHKKQGLLDLLEDHVVANIIKIGKKFFRQKRGIPQGSVLSSLLCNCFYARLEAEYLPSIMHDGAILLRLIDDFLFITTKQADAEQFLQIMHQGIEEYGVRVNPFKSLVNFSVDMNGSNIAQTATGALFPYCGTLIDTRTLEISKDRDRGKATALANALTVEQSSNPGQAFNRKAMNAFKIQTHQMFLDTSFNSISNVITNIYQNFFETAMKYYRYLRSLAPGKEPHAALLIETIRNLIDMAFVLIKSKSRGQASQEYHCAVSKRQVSWLALTAFHNVLKRKQTRFWSVLEWVADAMVDVGPKDRKEAARLTRAVERGHAAFEGFRIKAETTSIKFPLDLWEKYDSNTVVIRPWTDKKIVRAFSSTEVTSELATTLGGEAEVAKKLAKIIGSATYTFTPGEGNKTTGREEELTAYLYRDYGGVEDAEVS